MTRVLHSAGAWMVCPLCRREFGHMQWCPFDGCMLRPLESVAAAGERDASTDYLATVQLHWGGLFDTIQHDGLVHLVRGVIGYGTPGRLLCGIDQHSKPGPGFSVGGGISGPGIRHEPCPGCVRTARTYFAGVPIAGMRLASEPIAAAVGSEVYSHSSDVPAYRRWLSEARRRGAGHAWS